MTHVPLFKGLTAHSEDRYLKIATGTEKWSWCLWLEDGLESCQPWSAKKQSRTARSDGNKNRKAQRRYIQIREGKREAILQKKLRKVNPYFALEKADSERESQTVMFMQADGPS